MRPGCECCDVDLAPDGDDAMICSFECTWCRRCGAGHLAGTCPNCGGVLVSRPARPTGKLAANPASTTRVVRDEPCPEPV